MDNTVILGGKAEVAFGSVLVPAELLGDITPNFAEGTRDTTTLAGKRTKPSGAFDTAELAGTMFLPSMDALKALFPDDYNAPSGGQTSGNIIWGGNSCSTKEPLPINIHYTCDDNDNNDVHIFAGLVSMQFNPTYNESDGLSVKFQVYAQPTDDGIVRFGTGNLTAESIYDVDTMTTVLVTS